MRRNAILQVPVRFIDLMRIRGLPVRKNGSAGSNVKQVGRNGCLLLRAYITQLNQFTLGTICVKYTEQNRIPSAILPHFGRTTTGAKIIIRRSASTYRYEIIIMLFKQTYTYFILMLPIAPS